METATDNDIKLLEEMDMRPRGVPPEDAQSTTSEEEQVGEDPTKDLPPIYTADKWVDNPPPQRGEGWWGIGNPPRRLQEGLRGFQEGSKVDPRWIKDGSKQDPRRVQGGPRWFQDRSNMVPI